MATGDIVLSSTEVFEHIPAGTVIGYLSVEGGGEPTTPFALDEYALFIYPNPNPWTGFGGTYYTTHYFTLVGNAVVTVRELGFGFDPIIALSNQTSFVLHVKDVVDTFTGTSNQDDLQGTAGVDILIGQQGDDVIYGGAGVDTAVYSGNISDYVFKNEAGVVKVYDTRTGGDGKDVLTGVELLQFADKTVSANDLVSNAPPTDLSLSSSTIQEILGASSVVGILSAKDPEGRALSYSIVDNEYFVVVGNELRLKKPLDYEKAKNHYVAITATDEADNAVTAEFRIDVTDAIDIKYGSGRDDVLTGASGVDKIHGLSGNDRIVGNAGNDDLYGDGGNDKLFGGDGNDRLFGGAGADILTGGAGKDVFIYRSITDTTFSVAGRDKILDFDVKKGDKISLSDIDANTKIKGNQAFDFIGTKTFSGHAGELRYDKQAFNTYIYADVNGDKKVDFSIHLDFSTPVISLFFDL